MIPDPKQDWLPSHGVLDGITLSSVPRIGDVEATPVPLVQPYTLLSTSRAADTPAVFTLVPRCERGNGASAGCVKSCRCCP